MKAQRRNSRPMKKYLFFSLAAFSIVACRRDDDNPGDANNDPGNTIIEPVLPTSLANYSQQNLPAYYNNGPVAAADNTPANNPVTDHGATLGRVLFYDKQMSANNTMACASCHQTLAGFSDPNTFSLGFENGLTGRHSMSLANSRYYANGMFFWDERAATLEDQVLMPIQDEVEMGMDLDTLVQKLQALGYYDELFTNAFGSSTITADRMSRAMAQFIRSMVSFNSRYDEGRAQVNNPAANDFPNFTAEENRGKELFFDPAIGCAACHGTDAFIALGGRNNGLDADNTADLGRGGNTGVTAQEGIFKVGSLRNVEYSAPYMHDGRFATLEEVIEHYNSGVQNNPNLSPPLRLPGGGIRRLNLNASDQAALVAFLKTLSDDVIVNDEKFSDPFPDA